MIYIIFIMIKLSSQPMYPVDRGGAILGETTPMRMFYHRINVVDLQ